MIISPDIQLASEQFAVAATSELAIRLRRGLGDWPEDAVWIAWRLKTEKSIAEKAKRRGDSYFINDFVGIRVIVPHVGLLREAVTIVCNWASERDLSSRNIADLFVNEGMGHYRSVHLDFEFGNPESGLGDRCGLEVQITTYLQHFHGLLSHRLLYKRNPDPRLVNTLALVSERVAELDQLVARSLTPEEPK